MRILGLDYGSKTVGVAVSDPTGLIATGLEIIRRDREDSIVIHQDARIKAEFRFHRMGKRTPGRFRAGDADHGSPLFRGVHIVDISFFHHVRGKQDAAVFRLIADPVAGPVR